MKIDKRLIVAFTIGIVLLIIFSGVWAPYKAILLNQLADYQTTDTGYIYYHIFNNNLDNYGTLILYCILLFLIYKPKISSESKRVIKEKEK